MTHLMSAEDAVSLGSVLEQNHDIYKEYIRDYVRQLSTQVRKSDSFICFLVNPPPPPAIPILYWGGLLSPLLLHFRGMSVSIFHFNREVSLCHFISPFLLSTNVTHGSSATKVFSLTVV